MDLHIKNRIKRIAVLCCLGFILGTGVAWYDVNQEMDSARSVAAIQPASGSTIASAMDLGGDYTLVNQDGAEVTNNDFDGSYKLVFFGFTYCPEICPTELQKISLAMKNLGDSADSIQPIFITTDPDRDTPAVMKDYVGLFHPKLVGLTGTSEQITHVKDLYKVYAAKAQAPSATEYTMNHSAFTYFMGPDDELLAVFRSEDSAEDIVSEIKNIVENI